MIESLPPEPDARLRGALKPGERLFWKGQPHTPYRLVRILLILSKKFNIEKKGLFL